MIAVIMLLSSIIAAGDPLIDWLARGGPSLILAYVVVAFMKGWIVTGASSEREVNQLREERDKALELVYKQAEIAQRALEAGEKS